MVEFVGVVFVMMMINIVCKLVLVGLVSVVNMLVGMVYGLGAYERVGETT